jgi:hypothetical protein
VTSHSQQRQQTGSGRPTQNTTTASLFGFGWASGEPSGAAADGMFRSSTSGATGGSIMDDVVELNVGGTIHHVARQTLHKVPGTLFSDVASGKVKLARDKQGRLAWWQEARTSLPSSA